MEWQEAKDKFIQQWGSLGTEWGINRTMAQVHALLLISPRALSADEIMENLQISRGNVNINVRSLMDWGLVYKELKTGDRREYFIAEKDMWTVVRQILMHRKKRELDPVLRVLDELSNAHFPPHHEEALAVEKTIRDIKLFTSKADAILDVLIKSDSNWFIGTFLKLIKY